MKFEGSYYITASNNSNSSSNYNSNASNTIKNEAANSDIISQQEKHIDVSTDPQFTNQQQHTHSLNENNKSSKVQQTYNKSSSFCLKAFLEKTKSKVLNSSNNNNNISNSLNCENNCCQQHRLLTRTNRFSLKMLNHHNSHHHHHHHNKINIIKPIALRPNQAEMLKPNVALSYLNDLNSNYRFASIDSINSSSMTSSASINSLTHSTQRTHLRSPQLGTIQRRNTMPRVNFKNISFTSYVMNVSNTNVNQCQPQRPQLNFIKMKLQRYLNETCHDCAVPDLGNDLFKLKTFDILSLATLNLNGKPTSTAAAAATYHESPITCIMDLEETNNNVNLNNMNNCNVRHSLSASSSVSSLSSSLSNQNTFQMCLSSSNESDLDIAQIESDLNF